MEENKPIQNLIDIDGAENKRPPEKKTEDIIDLTEAPKAYNYSTGVKNINQNSNAYSTQVHSNVPINFFEN